jgi:RNA polymerase sigma-70 factor (ECF subfamily)
MNTTHPSLLQQLKQSADQAESKAAWNWFVRLYTPLLFYWARRFGLQDHDAADLVQDVFTVLVKKLPEFSYDGTGSFRGWLRTVTLNKFRDRLRQPVLSSVSAQPLPAELPQAEDSDVLEAVEYRRYVVQRALQLMQAEFAPKTWKACWEHVVNGRAAAEVASELGISVGSVYVAKSRVLTRLRQDLQGLLD